MADTIAILIKEDWTPPPSGLNQWAVKKGELGWARGHANQSGWAQVQILDSNRIVKVIAGQSSCFIPERIITRGASRSSFHTQIQPFQLSSYIPGASASESPLSRAVEALLGRICIEQRLAVENGAKSTDINRIRGDILGFKNRILEGMLSRKTSIR